MEFDRTWSQFVLDSTIPTLLGRYNHRTPLDFINRILSIKRSTSPSTANLREYGDRQSLGTFMNNILQKLTQTVGNESKPITERYRTKNRANERLKH
jgi:hypothetical protein